MQKKRTFKTIIWVVVAALLSVGGYTAVRAYQSPLAPALDLPALASPRSSNNDSIVARGAAPTASAATNNTCGQSGTMTILFSGFDSSFGEPPYGADTVRIVKVDFDKQKVNTVAFPRDLIVQTETLNDPAVLQQRLGLTYHYAYLAATGTPIEKNVAATRVLAQVMIDDFEVHPDYYFTLEMNSIADIVDTIGGVELTVPAAITTTTGTTFPVGKQTFNGALVTEYVRFLDSHGESARIARQNDFVKALQSKVMSVSILPQIPTLLTQFKEAFITDLSPEQLVSLACLAEKMPKGQVKFGAIDTTNLVVNDIPKIDAVKDYLARTLGD